MGLTDSMHEAAIAVDRMAAALRRVQRPADLDRALVDALKRRQLSEFLDALKKAQT